MDKKLEVVLTQTFDHKPLVTVSNLPGPDADLTPSQLRALAVALCMAAEECELQPIGNKQVRQKKRIYDILVGK